MFQIKKIQHCKDVISSKLICRFTAIPTKQDFFIFTFIFLENLTLYGNTKGHKQPRHTLEERDGKDLLFYKV